jgi:hypothetical protein
LGTIQSGAMVHACIRQIAGVIIQSMTDFSHSLSLQATAAAPASCD